ncbi:MAG: ABC transporter substrate-binding protein [Eubacteriales bacterium]|nr:ABC transporter substrate-binding protein [Eubacteriales bacterium]
MRRKKRMAAAFLAAVMVAGSLVSVPGTRVLAEEKTQESAEHVDVLRIGTTYKATSYSVMDTSSAFGRMLYNSFVNLNFWAFDENGQISTEGCFFDSWEVSEDNTQLTAHFDATDLYWHDGEPVTMEDVLFTFAYYQKQNYPWFLRISDVEAADEQTVRLTFEEGYAFAFVNSTNLMYGVLPKHVWEKVEDPAVYDGEDAAVGCGPYRLVSKDADAQVSYYEAVENYSKGEITVDKVELHSYDSQSSLIMAMQNNEIDVMYGYSASLDTTLLPLVDGDENIDRGESQNTATYQIMFGFNQYPTSDLNFRKAVRAALDYDLLCDSLTGGYGEVANQGAVSPSCLGYVDSLEKNSRDLELAAQYLDEGGYVDVDGDGFRELPDGSPMDVKIQLQNQTDLYKRIAEMLQINLEEVGIRTTVDEETIANSDYATQLRMEGTYEIYISMTTVGMATWGGIANYLADVTITSGQHFGTYADEDYLAAYNGILYSSSYEEYMEEFGKIQEMNASDCPGIALAIMETFYPYRTDRITGWTNYPAWGVINPTTWYTAVAK